MVQNMEHEKLVYGMNSWKEKNVNGSWCLGLRDWENNRQLQCFWGLLGTTRDPFIRRH